MTIGKEGEKAMSHKDCALDTPTAAAAALVRGWRLILAGLHDDTNARSQALDELDGCVVCLHCHIGTLAGMFGGALDDGLGREPAIRAVEAALAKAISRRDGPG